MGGAFVDHAAGAQADAVTGLAGERLELEPEPLLVIQGAYDVVNVTAGDGPRVVASAAGETSAVTNVLRAQRAGGALVLQLHPRCTLDVTVPRGTAVRLRVAKSRSSVAGVDDVDVFSAKGSLRLHDVGGRVRIRSAKEDIEVALSAQRETRDVSVMMAKGKFVLTVPAARGGVYRVDAAKTHVSVPPSVEGGVPVRVRAARSEIAIRAA